MAIRVLLSTTPNVQGNIKPLKQIPWGSVTAPAALVADVNTNGGYVTVGTHRYKLTFVDANGSETPLGTQSAVFTATTAVRTMGLKTIPTGGAGTVARNLYRNLAGDTGPYRLVAVIPDNSTTVYLDTTPDESIPPLSSSGNAATIPGLGSVWPANGEQAQDDPQRYSNFTAATTSKPYDVSACDFLMGRIYADAAATGSAQWESAENVNGPWAIIGSAVSNPTQTGTAVVLIGVGAAQPVGPFVRLNATALSAGGPIRADLSGKNGKNVIF